MDQTFGTRDHSARRAYTNRQSLCALACLAPLQYGTVATRPLVPIRFRQLAYTVVGTSRTLLLCAAS